MKHAPPRYLLGQFEHRIHDPELDRVEENRPDCAVMGGGGDPARIQRRALHSLLSAHSPIMTKASSAAGWDGNAESIKCAHAPVRQKVHVTAAAHATIFLKK